MDRDTIELLQGSLRHVLTEAADGSFADRLAELGWDDVIADDEAVALRTLFEIKGEVLSGVDALGPELASTLAASTDDARVASAGVVIPFPDLSGVGPDGSLTVTGVLSGPAAPASLVAVVERGADLALALVPTTAVTIRPMGGTDPELGLQVVTGQVGASVLVWIGDDQAEVWGAAVARGRWLLAAELVGVARHVLAAAVDYTGARVQYGKPIGVFQALQHRVAGAHALVVGAGHLVTEAAESADPWTAMVAKALAGRAAETACTQAQQCYGAIGFTWEHEFHRYLRRTYLLDSLLGDWRTLEFDIGNELQRTGVVPRIGTI